MAEVAGDLVRRSTSSQEVDVDRAAALRILFGKIGLRDTRSDAGGGGIEGAAHQIHISPSGRPCGGRPATPPTRQTAIFWRAAVGCVTSDYSRVTAARCAGVR